jgi:quercetin dioxygenase-like cupin family protein
MLGLTPKDQGAPTRRSAPPRRTISTVERQLAAVQLRELELAEAWSASEPSVRASFAFPIHADSGAVSTSVVYFELEPGFSGPRHTDSAEEILLVLEGSVELVLDEQRMLLSAGGLALLPALVPHGFHNVGQTTVRAVGFFSSAAVIHTFEEPLAPFGSRAFVSPSISVD